MKLIYYIDPVTGPQFESAAFLLEPLGFDEEQLPEGLLVSPTLVPVRKGFLYAPVVNVGNTKVWFPPRHPIGTVQVVVATATGTAASISVDPSWEQCQSYVSTQEVAECYSFPELAAPDFPGLTQQQAAEARALLVQDTWPNYDLSSVSRAIIGDSWRDFQSWQPHSTIW